MWYMYIYAHTHTWMKRNDSLFPPLRWVVIFNDSFNGSLRCPCPARPLISVRNETYFICTVLRFMEGWSRGVGSTLPIYCILNKLLLGPNLNKRGHKAVCAYCWVWCLLSHRGFLFLFFLKSLRLGGRGANHSFVICSSLVFNPSPPSPPYLPSPPLLGDPWGDFMLSSRCFELWWFIFFFLAIIWILDGNRMKEESLFHTVWQSDVSFQKDALKSICHLEEMVLFPFCVKRWCTFHPGFHCHIVSKNPGPHSVMTQFFTE